MSSWQWHEGEWNDDDWRKPYEKKQWAPSSSDEFEKFEKEKANSLASLPPPPPAPLGAEGGTPAQPGGRGGRPRRDPFWPTHRWCTDHWKYRHIQFLARLKSGRWVCAGGSRCRMPRTSSAKPAVRLLSRAQANCKGFKDPNGGDSSVPTWWPTVPPPPVPKPAKPAKPEKPAKPSPTPPWRGSSQRRRLTATGARAADASRGSTSSGTKFARSRVWSWGRWSGKAWHRAPAKKASHGSAAPHRRSGHDEKRKRDKEHRDDVSRVSKRA
mmetsp:Transcript_125835/g.246626  ORF Transcript_125835/g.246626 Transcript_125835/m.246626 type:complete len:269 (+) Transcript_125835:75-881(+)